MVAQSFRASSSEVAKPMDSKLLSLRHSEVCTLARQGNGSATRPSATPCNATGVKSRTAGLYEVPLKMQSSRRTVPGSAKSGPATNSNSAPESARSFPKLRAQFQRPRTTKSCCRGAGSAARGTFRAARSDEKH